MIGHRVTPVGEGVKGARHPGAAGADFRVLLAFASISMKIVTPSLPAGLTVEWGGKKRCGAARGVDLCNRFLDRSGLAY
jgi:hypothetical protein